jgi:hypothetical protein
MIYRIVHNASKSAVIAAINDIPMDGSKSVKIIDSGSKSARQRAYQWLLYNEIIKSGKGDADTAQELDLRVKYRARDLFFEDDDLLSDLFAYVGVTHPTQLHDFVSHYMHTEKLSTKMMAKYLDSIINYYGPHIPLPDPAD